MSSSRPRKQAYNASDDSATTKADVKEGVSRDTIRYERVYAMYMRRICTCQAECYLVCMPPRCEGGHQCQIEAGELMAYNRIRTCNLT